MPALLRATHSRIEWMKLEGVFSPIATPFDYNGDLYLAKIRHNVEKWNRTGLAGYVVGGSAGEGVLLTCEEKLRLWGAVREAAAGKLLIAATGRESVRETVELTNLAAGIGYNAALVGAPHHYKDQMGNGAAQALYFRTVADRTKIPIIICNAPQAAGIDIAAQTVLDLAGHPNIVGVEERSGSIEKIMELVNGAPEGFPVFAGSEAALWPSLMAGAAGAIVALANPAPYACISIYEAVRTREVAAAADLQKRLSPAAGAIARHGVPGLKYAMDLNAYYGGPPRLPLLPATSRIKREVEEAFRDVRG
jgi:4-hydroxy-2-oxoglutarate aldolase